MSTTELWMLVLNAVMAIGTFGALIVMIISLNKKTGTSISPQPLNVEIVKALHEQFASQEDFLRQVENNTERHNQIFTRIEMVERESRQALQDAVNGINADRAKTMEKLNEQFTFIRESLSAINAELKLNRDRARN